MKIRCLFVSPFVAVSLANAQPAPPAEAPSAPPTEPVPTPAAPTPATPEDASAAPVDAPTAEPEPSTEVPTDDGISIESIQLESLLATSTRDPLKLEAFGDISVGFLAGAARNASDASRFAAFGLDLNPKNSQSGFGLAGTDFVLSGDISDKIRYLGEVNFQVERGASSDFEIDVERMMIDFSISERIAIQAGLFFTPIGYHNRTQYSRAWLMYAASIPALFEEELGFVPTHTVGVQAYGTLDFPVGDAYYAFSVGNGRALDPATNMYARDNTPKAYTGMLEFRPRAGREMAFGISGWFDQIETFRLDDAGSSLDIITPGAPGIELREIGLDVHATVDTDRFALLAEYVMVSHVVTDGVVLPIHQRTRTHGLYLEAAYHATSKIHPFVNYTRVKLPEDGGPYFPLRASDDTLTRFYVPNEHQVSAGVAYDVVPSNRLKLEYSLALEGPRKAHGFILQTAFAIR